MNNDAYIPIDVVRKELEAIEGRLSELKRETSRLRDEEALLAAKRVVLTEIEQKAVRPSPKSRPTQTRIVPRETNPTQIVERDREPGQDILNGRIATPIILKMIRERPGIKSTDVIDALDSRVRKDIRKGPRKFLGDLLWELGHRNKLKRQPDGCLYLVNQGGDL